MHGHRIATAVFLAGCGGTTDDDLSALRERVAVLEAAAGSEEPADAGDDLEERITAVEEDVAGLLGSDEGTLTASVSALQDEVDELSDQVSVIVPGGGVWSATGSGTGTCALLLVETDSDAPLVVITTVKGNISVEGALNGNVNLSLSASDVADTWSETTNVGVSVNADINDYGAPSGTHDGVAVGQVAPIVQVFEIPAAGDYMVRLDVTTSAPVTDPYWGAVTASAGSCDLVVFQLY